MRTRRKIIIGSATFLAIVATATAAAAANSVSATLYGTDTVTKSTVGCSAGMWATAANDTAATSGLTAGCSLVTVKIYYTNTRGYAGWTSTKSDPDYVLKGLGSGDELVKSYHTAVARSTGAE